MKITNIALAVVAGLFTSSVFAAGGVALTGSSKVVAVSACSMLNEDTTINTSKDVAIGYVCDVANNVLAVGTCHPNGSRKSSTVPCVGQDTDNDGTPDKFTPNGCSASTPTITLTEARGYSVYNTGGSVGVVEMDAACTDASIAGKL